MSDKVPYVQAYTGNAGSFGKKDAPELKPDPEIKKGGQPWKRIKREGRELDAAGKLRVQTARPDLKKSQYVDPDRHPTFIQTESPQ